MKILSGGGIQGNKVVQSRSGVKVEPITHKGNPAAVAQQGLAVQFRKEPITSGKGYEPERMPPTGVAGKYNAATSGPGSQRTTYAKGTQAQYGSPAGNAVNRAPDPPATRTAGPDILSGYGSEMKRR